METKKDDKAPWVIGGGTLLGLGVGFTFLPESPMLFVASLYIGIGAGLLIAPFLTKKGG